MNSIVNTYRLLIQTSDAIESTMKTLLSPHGLNCNEYMILDILSQKGNQTMIYQIGKEIRVTSSSITYLIDQLEKKDCILRQLSPNDCRVTVVHIAQSGQELMEKVLPEHQKKIEEGFNCFTQEEAQKMIPLLEK